MISQTAPQAEQHVWLYRPIKPTDRPRYGFSGYTAAAAEALARQVGVRLVAIAEGPDLICGDNSPRNADGVPETTDAS